MEAHNEASDNMDDSESTFQETFRPVLTNLRQYVYPKLSPSQEDALVAFFRESGVTKLRELSIFDSMILWEKRSECDLFESERLCFYLGYICCSLTIDIGMSMDKAFEYCYNFAYVIHDYCRRRKNNRRSEFDMENLSPSCSDRLTFFTAQVLLFQIFDGTDIYLLSHSARIRKAWPTECVLAILKRFPFLALEEYPIHDTTVRFQPYYFFLVAGFEKVIVQEVHSYCPKVTESGPEDPTPEMVLPELLFPQIYGGSSNRVGASIDALRVALELHPGLASANKNGWLLLEKMFRGGAREEEMELVRRFLSKDVDTFTFHMTGIGQLRVFGRVLQQLRELTVLMTSPEAGTFVIFKLLHTCEQTKLETLKIDIPVDIICENEDAKGAMEVFLEKMPVRLKTVSLTAKDSGPAVQIDFTSCLESITKSIVKGNWYLEELSLCDFFYNTNAIEPLFIENIIGSLDFQILNERSRYAIPWIPPDKADGVRIGRLNLYQGKFSADGWLALWQAISRATKLENILFAPGNERLSRQPDSLLKAFEAMSMIPRLKTICIGPHGGDASISITAPLVSILAHRGLEFLQVEGSFLDEREDTYGCHAYSINTDKFCQALLDNKSLQFLFLRGVELEGSDVAKTFLDVLEEHNNTTIEFMDLCDDKYFYSIIPKAKDSWRRDLHHGFSYENYAHSWRLYYLTCFNRYGRGKVQDKKTTVDELVRLLQELHPGTGLESEEEIFYSNILKIASPVRGVSSEGHLSDLYELLRSSPKLWYNVVRRDIEVLSLRYGLLRETPCLWCVGALEGGDVTRKRKHVG